METGVHLHSLLLPWKLQGMPLNEVEIQVGVLLDQVLNGEEKLGIHHGVLVVNAVEVAQKFEKLVLYLLLFFRVKRVVVKKMVSRILAVNFVYVAVHVMGV